MAHEPGQLQRWDTGPRRSTWRGAFARAIGDDPAYREWRDRYRAMATSLGFEGHMKWAEAMP